MIAPASSPLSESSPFLRSIGDVGARDVQMAGCHGASLGELLQAGLPVAPGFVVTAQAFVFAMERAGVRDLLRDGARDVPQNPLMLAEVSDNLQQLVQKAGMPEDMARAMVRAATDMGSVRFAVRCSCVLDDSSYEARTPNEVRYTNVPASEVPSAVQKCWSSRFAQGALDEQRGTDGEPMAAVVVQRMLRCEKSGLLFTIDPSTADRTRAVVDRLSLDEVLIGARVDPNRYVMDKASHAMVSRSLSRASDGWLVESDGYAEVLSHERATRVLDDAELTLLTDAAMQLDTYCGAPRKVQWGFAGGKLYFLRNLPLDGSSQVGAATLG
jgi:pyruvate,water dikinase